MEVGVVSVAVAAAAGFSTAFFFRRNQSPPVPPPSPKPASAYRPDRGLGEDLGFPGLKGLDHLRSFAGTAKVVSTPRVSYGNTAEEPVKEQASGETDLDIATKLKKTMEQIHVLEAKLQETVNENAKLKARQTEDAKLWKELDSKLSSTKTLYDQHLVCQAHAEFPLFPKSGVTEPVSRPAPKQCYKSKCNVEGSSSGCSHHSSIQFDKIRGLVIPEEKKDEMLLELASVVQELEAQLNGWTEWAEKKVMQAVHRLSKDKAELHTLRHEKDGVSRLYLEKQTLEENTVKMLTDMENALSKATGQVVKANKDVCILGVENSRLKQELQDAKSLADKSAAACQEFSLREMAAPEKFQSGEREKAMLNEELATEKRELLRLKHQLEQANEHLGHLEVRWRQEEKVKESAVTHAKMERKSREHNEVSAKLKDDAVKAKAESDLEICRDDIRRLKHEIAESKMGALKEGIDGNIEMSSEIVDEVESGSGEVHRDRECVVCLSEERSVVFLPCAHQVVCTNCNQIHEEQGVWDCPSCRTPIQRRILPVSYYLHYWV